MNPTIREIEENLPDFDQFVIWFNQHTYTNTSLENCQRWELREALSYYFENVTVKSIVSNIVKNVKNTTEFKWTNKQVTLVDEAKIQHLLRKSNIDITGCDVWPTNTLNLLQLTKKIKLSNQIKYKLVDRMLSLYENINFSTVKSYKYLLFFATFSTIFGVWTMFFQSLLIGYLAWIFLDISRHEYFEHKCVELKLPWLTVPFNWIMYHLSPALYHDTTLSSVHNIHHTRWKTSDDQLTYRVRREVIPGILDYDLGFLTKPNNVSELAWPYRYYIEIKLILLSISVVLFGPMNVFYYTLLPLSIIGILQLQHDWYLSKVSEKDHPWLFLLTYNQAWHYTHHITYKKKPNSINDLFMGPSWVKYVNPQYYFVRLFFKFKT